MASDDDSEFVQHCPCDACGSSDANSLYSDGHLFCHACRAYTPGDGDVSSEVPRKAARLADLLTGEFQALAKRGIKEETCRKWGYRVGRMSDQTVQIADIWNPEGTQVVAQKVRFANKDFKLIGNLKDGGLYGQHLWREKGKMVVVTEGEIDALTVSQLQDLKWPVVSVPNGAAGAKKALARSLDWLLGFDHIVLFFDNDKDGQEATQECAALFPVGRCKVARMADFKDPNEAHQAGKSGQVIEAIWGAKVFRPDGIVRVSDIKQKALTPPEQGFPWFNETLTKHTYGRRLGEVYAVGAGTGVGKTDLFTQQVQYDCDELGEKVGLFFLEQNPEETLKRVAGKFAGKHFHIPDGTWTQEELAAALDRLEADDRVFFYDNFGATEWDTIAATIRFLAHAEGVRLFYLDHLTALAAAEEDERKALERIMAAIASLAKELGIVIHLISHLATPEGKPHEEGGRVMIRHFKGSRAIGFWCHYMFGLERDQQHEDPAIRTVTTFRVLKDRYTGRATGQTIYFGFDQETGWLFETEPPSEGSAHGFRDETRPGEDDAF